MSLVVWGAGGGVQLCHGFSPVEEDGTDRQGPRIGWKLGWGVEN